MNNVKFSIFPQYLFLDLNLYQCGYEACSPLQLFGPSVRNHYLFHYVLSGKGTLISKGSDNLDQEIEIEAGEGFLILPGQVATYIADEDDPWEYMWIEIDGLIVEEAFKTAGFSCDNPLFSTTDKELSGQLEAVMLDIINENHPGPYKKIGQLYEFLHLLNSNRYQESKNTYDFNIVSQTDFYIKEFIQYIKNHYHENISIEKAANFLNLSRSYINKIFKKRVGQSPKEFLINFRMHKAEALLKTTNLSIGEVGTEVGYPNQLHFSRAFKNHYGLSPKAWRNQNKIINQ